MHLRTVLALIALTALLTPVGRPGLAHAQTFSELARDAVEVPEDVASWAAPLLVDCRGRSAAAERQCAQGRSRATAAQLRGTYVLDVAGRGRVSIAPYEAHNGGFRVRLPGLVFARPAGGLVATGRVTEGLLAPQVLAEGFVRVSREAAGRFVATNALDKLRVRVVFRVGEHFTDAAAIDRARGYGVTLEVLGAQVYNEDTGTVLADSLARGNVPGAGSAMLMGRTVLWSRAAREEAAWLAPTGETVLFHTRIEPVADQPGTLSTTVLATYDGAPMEIVRFVAPCCTAAVDLRPHGPGVLMIITEVASQGASAGRGRVLFLAWRPDHRFEIAARWEGDNRSAPPAWLRDPSAVPDAPVPQPAPEPDGPSEAPRPPS